MKKLFLVALASISLSVFAGEKVVENTVITTNELSQITKVVTFTKGDKTTTVVFEDAGFQVPLKYRAKWSSMTDEEKNKIKMESSMVPEFNDVILPVEVEYVPIPKRVRVDSTTRVVRLREDDENE